MRIIHEFYGCAQTTGSGNPYAFRITEPPPKSVGFQLELMAVDTSGKGKKFKEGDALYIEGDGKAIKNMLKGLLEVIEIIEEDCAKRHNEHAARVKKCDGCGCWFDGKHDCDYFKKNLKRKWKSKK